MIRIPKKWQAEIAAGTEFGARAAAVIEKHNKQQKVRDRKRTNETPRAIPLNRELVGTALRQTIERLVDVKTGKGCGCTHLASQMDSWGIAGCERRRDEIIGHLVGNRDVLLEALKMDHGWLGHAITWGVSMLPDSALRKGAGWLLDEAIEKVKAEARTQRTQSFSARRNMNGARREYTGWRSVADGPVFEMGPFESKIRHLTYFVFPRTEDSWKWNLQQLAKRWWLFNGTRILGIAHDEHTGTPDAVVQYAESLGMKFDYVLKTENHPKKREVVLWVPMLSILKPGLASADEVVFSAHAKGQKYDDPEHTRDWTDLMYQSCLDDWPSVYNALRTSLMAGSFREYGLPQRWHNWAYSGTFYWWRLAELGKRKWNDVDQWFMGTESWPGKMCDPRETACLFLNDSRRMYDQQYWKDVVWPEWEKYKAKMHVSNHR